MASEDFTVDVESLIAEIKKYPEIWNIGSEHHKDRRKKIIAWKKVSAALYHNFRRKSEEEQKVICQKYMNKWRNIRDQFLKTMRKRSMGTPVRQYIYAKHLSFLISTDTFPVTKSEVKPEEEETGDVDMSSSEEHTEAYLPPPAVCQKDSESSVMNEVTCSYSPVMPEQDEDRAFFDSLIPLVKSFSVDQILEFRIGVLNLIKTIRWSDGNQLQ